LLLLVLFTLWRRVWGGTDLLTLIRRRPEAGPEGQRILSAIRHEGLKHNTLVLTRLVEAIERGDALAAKAPPYPRSLFGAGGQEAVVDKLRSYASQLEQLGRNHRVRLNLRRKDRALAALLKGFRLLERVAPELSQMDYLPRRRRTRVLRRLRLAARL